MDEVLKVSILLRLCIKAISGHVKQKIETIYAS